MALATIHPAPRSATGVADEAVVLLAAGSADARHARDVERLAARVRDEVSHEDDVVVATAFLDHDAPSPQHVARALADRGVRTIRLVPFAFGSSRVTRTRAAVVMRAAAPGVEVTETAPIGDDAAIADAVADLLAAGCAADVRTGVVVVTEAGPAPGLERALTRSTLPPGRLAGWAGVRVASLDGGHGVLDAAVLLRRLDQADEVIAVPAVLADGPRRDRLARVAALAGIPLVDGALADTTAMAIVVAERARGAG